MTSTTKKINQKHTVQCHNMSSQITLAAPPARGLRGASAGRKKNERKKKYSPVPQFSRPITQTMAQHRVGGSAGRKTSKNHPTPSPSRRKTPQTLIFIEKKTKTTLEKKS